MRRKGPGPCGEASTATAVKNFNQEHDITGKVWKAGEAAAVKAKEVNEKYGITTKMAAAVRWRGVYSRHHN